jgi:hypothetical protein
MKLGFCDKKFRVERGWEGGGALFAPISVLRVSVISFHWLLRGCLTLIQLRHEFCIIHWACGILRNFRSKRF